MESNKPIRLVRVVVLLCILALAGYLRWRAVDRLPVDFDELTYLPAAFKYSEMLAAGDWRKVIEYREVLEHPAFNKLLFAKDVELRKPKEPNWDALNVGKPIPEQDRSAFLGSRLISAVGGTLQVLIATIVHPIGGLFLAFNSYHVKYSGQVYLEGIPGFFAVLSVFLFELSVGRIRTAEKTVPRSALLFASAASLGLSAAGKYLYGIAGFVTLAFLIIRTRSVRSVLLYVAIAVATFFLADPYLWTHPASRLWESLTYHWHYAHGEHVVSTGLPWYTPFKYFLEAMPTQWHRGVFLTGIADVLILPLALIAVPRAVRERPIWVAWAGVGLLFLLFWPTKWPQYILLVLPPICVCAGLGAEQILSWIWGKIRRRTESPALS